MKADELAKQITEELFPYSPHKSADMAARIAPLIAAKLPQWISGAPPETLSDGTLLLVELKYDEAGTTFHVYEYHGQPVSVVWHGHKGKTTFDARRIEPDDVVRYAVMELPAPAEAKE